MKAKIAVIGASIGGLIAAAVLREKGFHVTVIERGKSVAGLYGKVSTPFGEQELGMHVLYLSDEHLRHLNAIFGSDNFHTWGGHQVDVGACHNFGRNFFDSIYPDVRGLASAKIIFGQVCEEKDETKPSLNAAEAVSQRFGDHAAKEVFVPILEKLWKIRADKLTKDAIHCFFDLRRIIVCDKEQADSLKEDAWLDAVIGNPLQSQPKGEVFGGRQAVRFKSTHGDLSGSVSDWATRTGVDIQFEKSVEIVDQGLLLDGVAVDERFDACIVATPASTMVPQLSTALDHVELSIYYFKLAETLADSLPAYYILCHSSELASCRIVNYGAYHEKPDVGQPCVVAVEVLHPVGMPPADQEIASELTRVLPDAVVNASYRLPRSLRVACPSLNNANRIDAVLDGMETRFKNDALFFTGMRTDKGIFFSHHTIGLAYDAALECARRLS